MKDLMPVLGVFQSDLTDRVFCWTDDFMSELLAEFQWVRVVLCRSHGSMWDFKVDEDARWIDPHADCETATFRNGENLAVVICKQSVDRESLRHFLARVSDSSIGYPCTISAQVRGLV